MSDPRPRLTQENAVIETTIQPDFDDGTRLAVDTDVIQRWQGDFDRIDAERHLHAVPNPPEPPAEAWRALHFIGGNE